MTSRPRLVTGLLAMAAFVALIAAAAVYVAPDAFRQSSSATPLRADAVSTSPVVTSSVAPPLPVRTCRSGKAAAKSSPGTVTVGDHRPRLRSVNIGFEDITSSDPNRLKELADRLDQVDANGVSIAVGRLDWIGFPWKGHESMESSDVRDTGRDYVAEAIAALRCDRDGHARQLTLGIDTLLGRDLLAQPELAGRRPNGTPSDLFASLTAWKTGPLTNRLSELAHEVAIRYHPDSINVTELMFDQFTFGKQDKADFHSTTGLTSWPRSPDGSINADSPAMRMWRSQAAAGVMAKVSRALAADGVRLAMDVRQPAHAHPEGRPDIGHNYPMLLRHVDLLNVWDFPGVTSSSAFTAKQLAGLVFHDAPDRYALEIGLWKGSGIIPLSTLRRELKDAAAQGIQAVAVTPASKMSAAAWAVLADAWRQPARATSTTRR